jgi:hypothetical protein
VGVVRGGSEVPHRKTPNPSSPQGGRRRKRRRLAYSVSHPEILRIARFDLLGLGLDRGRVVLHGLDSGERLAAPPSNLRIDHIDRLAGLLEGNSIFLPRAPAAITANKSHDPSIAAAHTLVIVPAPRRHVCLCVVASPRYLHSPGDTQSERLLMLRVAVTTLAAVAFVATTVVPNSAEAAKRRVHHSHARLHFALAAVPPPYYGMPATYVPAPPFPFFLIPGPWWLPAHP